MKEILEEWRDIAGYEGKYQVSSLGRMKALNYQRTGMEVVLKTFKNDKGYMQITLAKDGKKKSWLIHRLVAKAFLPNPDSLPQVNHKNEVKTVNSVDNLEWCSAQYNTNYGTSKERRSKRQMNRADHSKRVIQSSLDGKLIKVWPSAKEAARQCGYDHPSICSCCRGGRYRKGKWEKKITYMGYKWQYA